MNWDADVVKQFITRVISSRGLYYLVGGACCLVLSGVSHSWLLSSIFLWFALCCMYIGIGYLFSLNRILFKTPRGRIPTVVKAILLPFFLGTNLYNWCARRSDRMAPIQELFPGLFIGRRLLVGDIEKLEQLNIKAILDVTIEFDTLARISADMGYRYCNLPVFDHSVPSLQELQRAVSWIDERRREGDKVLVHCALGRGRSAMVLFAYLLYKNPQRGLDAMIGTARQSRSKIRPNFRQLRLLAQYRSSNYVKKSRASIIINPTAGQKIESSTKAQIEHLLSPFYVLEFFETSADVDAQALAKEAVDKGVSVIVACGGDGTVSQVAAALAGTDAVLAIIPCGTANAMAASLYGITTHVETLETSCERIAAFNTKAIDLGRCETRYFILLAGVGFEQGMVQRSEKMDKAGGGVLTYLLGALEEFSDPHVFNVKLTADGQKFEFSSSSVVVANAAPHASIFAQGGGLPDCQDGYLDITWLEVEKDQPLEHMLSLGELIKRQVSGGESPGQRVKHLRAKRIDIDAGCQNQVVLDGELLECNNLSFAVIPKALNVIDLA